MSLTADRYLHRGEDFVPARDNPPMNVTKAHYSTETTTKQPSVCSTELYHTYSTLRVCSFFIAFGAVLGSVSVALYYLVGNQNSMVDSSNPPPQFMYQKHFISESPNELGSSSEGLERILTECTTTPSTESGDTTPSANTEREELPTTTSNHVLSPRKNNEFMIIFKKIASELTVTTENPVLMNQERNSQDVLRYQPGFTPSRPPLPAGWMTQILYDVKKLCLDFVEGLHF